MHYDTLREQDSEMKLEIWRWLPTTCVTRA